MRQARRIFDDDTDELGLLHVDHGESWWVARRLSDTLTVWAYPGDDEAADGYERQLCEPGWVEALPAELQVPESSRATGQP